MRRRRTALLPALACLLLASTVAGLDCAPGSFDNGGACEGCPDSTFQPSAGATSCLPVPVGALRNAERTGWTCDGSEGWYLSGDECLQCEENQVVEGNGCKLCPAGTYRTDDALCAPCEEGSWNPLEGQTVCMELPLGADETADFTSFECRFEEGWCSKEDESGCNQCGYEPKASSVLTVTLTVVSDSRGCYQGLIDAFKASFLLQPELSGAMADGVTVVCEAVAAPPTALAGLRRLSEGARASAAGTELRITTFIKYESKEELAAAQQKVKVAVQTGAFVKNLKEDLPASVAKTLDIKAPVVKADAKFKVPKRKPLRQVIGKLGKTPPVGKTSATYRIKPSTASSHSCTCTTAKKPVKVVPKTSITIVPNAKLGGATLKITKLKSKTTYTCTLIGSNIRGSSKPLTWTFTTL